MIARRLVLSLMAALFMTGIVMAGDDKAADLKEATGKVKSVTETGFVLTDATAKDMTFETGKMTTVMAKGATHSLDASAGAAPKLTELLSTDQEVTVKYKEKDGKMWAKHVTVK